MRPVMFQFAVPALLVLGCSLPARTAFAQGQPAAAAAKAAATPAPAPAPAPTMTRRPQPIQPDFWVINQPTTLRLPKHTLAFRVTHRFTRSFNQGASAARWPTRSGSTPARRSASSCGSRPSRGAGRLSIGPTTRRFISTAATTCCSSAATVPVGVVSRRRHRRNRQLHGQLLAVDRRVDLPHLRAGAGRLCRSHVGQQHQPAAAGPRRSERHVPVGSRRPRSPAPRPLDRRGVVAAPERLQGRPGAGDVELRGRKTLAAFAIEQRVGGHVFQINFSNGCTPRRRPTSPGVRPPARPIGTSGSTSRGSSTDSRPNTASGAAGWRPAPRATGR